MTGRRRGEQARAVRHHVVPRFYLRRFADARDLIAVFDAEEDRDENISPRQASVISDFYTIDVGAGPSDEIERRLSEIESRAAEALRRIDAGTFPPTTQDRGAIASFMALQHVRGPQFRATQDRTATLMMQLASRVAASQPNYVREMWRRTNGADPTESELELAIEQFGRGEVEVTLTREHHIGVMLELGASIFPYFFGRRWFLAQGTDLVTSDMPVILWSRPERRAIGIGVMTADEIVMPIAPDRALVLLQPFVASEERTLALTERGNLVLRSRARANAQRHTYRRPGTSLPSLDDAVAEDQSSSATDESDRRSD